MSSKINNLQDALSYVARLDAIAEEFASMTSELRVYLSNVVGVPAAFPKGMPDSLVDRVKAIFEGAEGPLTAKEVAAEYVRRKWPEPENGQLYSTIYGTISYLFGDKKRFLGRDGRGAYFVRPQETELSEEADQNSQHG